MLAGSWILSNDRQDLPASSGLDPVALQSPVQVRYQSYRDPAHWRGTGRLLFAVGTCRAVSGY